MLYRVTFENWTEECTRMTQVSVPLTSQVASFSGEGGSLGDPMVKTSASALSDAGYNTNGISAFAGPGGSPPGSPPSPTGSSTLTRSGSASSPPTQWATCSPPPANSGRTRVTNPNGRRLRVVWRDVPVA